jgi:hypothetical protein
MSVVCLHVAFGLAAWSEASCQKPPVRCEVAFSSHPLCRKQKAVLGGLLVTLAR